MKTSTVAVIYLPVELEDEAVSTFDLLSQAISVAEGSDVEAVRATIRFLDAQLQTIGLALFGGRVELLRAVLEVMGDDGCSVLEALTVLGSRDDALVKLN